MKKCPKCGAPLTQIDDVRYKCENCNACYKWVPKQPTTEDPSAWDGNSTTTTVDTNNEQTAISNIDDTASRPQTTSDILSSAHNAMSGHYGFAILTSILLNLVKYGSILLTAVFGPLLIGGMTKCSLAGFYLDVANGKQSDISSTFRGFKYMKKSIATQLILLLFKVVVYGALIALYAIIRLVGNIWFTLIFSLLLLIIFAIVFIWTNSIDKTVYFLMIDREDPTAKQGVISAFKIVSKNFKKFFLLNLSFLGWAILTVMTFGILILYVDPYYQTAYAKLYMELKDSCKA